MTSAWKYRGTRTAGENEKARGSEQEQLETHHDYHPLPERTMEAELIFLQDGGTTTSATVANVQWSDATKKNAAVIVSDIV